MHISVRVAVGCPFGCPFSHNEMAESVPCQTIQFNLVICV